MISKELLSEVLGRKVIEVSDLQYANNCLNICGEEGIFLGAYNIHELAHKVKEWAYSIGYGLTSSYSTSDGGKWMCTIHEYEVEYHSAKHSDTETEAIFKAGQWILDNK